MRDQHSGARRSAAPHGSTTTTNNNNSSGGAGPINNSGNNNSSRTGAAGAAAKTGAGRPTNNNNNNTAKKSDLWLADESDSDWDYGVGNLVIDLESEQSLGDSDPASGSASASSSASASALATSTMNSPHKSSPPNKTEHQATVNNKGLKMKITKRNTGGATKQPTTAAGATATGPGGATATKSTTEPHHEITKPEPKSGVVNNSGEASGSTMPSSGEKLKQGPPEKDKKGRSTHKKERKDKSKVGDSHVANGGAFINSSTAAVSGHSSSQHQVVAGTSTATELHHRPHNSSSSSGGGGGQAAFPIKKETPVHDPYEFNAKVEDRIGFPVTKKIKVEKSDTATSPVQPSSQDGRSHSGGAPGPSSSTASGPTPSTSSGDTHDKAVATQHIGVVTDPDCLGPCEPGTSVTLEGIVWHETDNGVLVVNVTWRGKTYVGTLLDATRHDWAPPRFSSDSPTSDIDSRTPKGRGKRGRGAGGATPKPEVVGDRRLRNRRSFPAPPSPARSEVTAVGKRRAAQAAEAEREASNGDGPLASKRSRSSSRSTPTRNTANNGRDSPNWIECPEPNCFKKYKHSNGLKYHQTKAHPPPEEKSSGRSRESRHKDKDTETPMDTEESQPVPSTSRDNRHSHGHGHMKTYSKGGKKPHTVTSATINVNTTTTTTPQEKNTGAAAASKAAAAAVQDTVSSSEQNTTTVSSTASSAVTKDTKAHHPKGAHHTQPPAGDSNKKSDSKAKSSPPPAASTTSFSQAHMDSNKAATAVTATTSTTQVYQLATAPIACLGGTMTVVTQSLPANQVAVTGGATVVQATTTQIPVGTAISALPVTMIPTSQHDAKKSRTDKVDNKSKPKTGVSTTRPIVPAPVVTNSHNVHPTQGTGSSTSQLKAIQPRPTIMGEPSTINPALTSLRDMKEKKCKKSKKEHRKDKERAKDLAAAGAKPSINVPILSPGTNSSSVTSSAAIQQQSVDSNKAVPSSTLGSRPESLTTSVIKTVPTTLPSVPSAVTAKTGSAEQQQQQQQQQQLYSEAAGLVTQQQQQQHAQHKLQQQQLQHHQQQQQQQQQGSTRPPELLKVPEMLQKPPELQKQPAIQTLPEKMDSNLGVGQHVTRPPSSLSINSPLQGADRERCSDVHSPAYSDISDANDTAPTLENEAEQKPVGDKGAEPMNIQKNRAHDAPMGPSYPLFDTGVQPPYLLPAISHPGLQQQQQGRDSQAGTPDSHCSSSKSADRPAEPKMGSFQKAGEGGKDSGPHPHDLQGRASYQNYVTSAYGYAIDPAYHMHLMNTDPQYRAQHEKLRSEQEKSQRDTDQHNNETDNKTVKPSESGDIKPDDGTNKPVDSAGKPGEKVLPPAAAGGKDYKGALPKPPSLVSDKEREEQRRREMVSEQSLMEKKNENHQILKENLELKTQMESSNRVRTAGFEQNSLNARHQTDMAMYYNIMYLQQQQQQQAQAQHSPGQGPPRKAPETVTSPPKEGNSHPEHKQHGGHSPDTAANKPLDLDCKRQRSVSREGSRDGPGGRPRETETHKRLEEKLVKSESKSPSPRPSPRPGSTDSRLTPSKPRDLPSSAAGPVPSMPSPYTSYFHPGYMPQAFPGGMPMDLVRHPGAQLAIDPRHGGQLAIDPRQLDPRQLDPRQIDPRQIDPRQIDPRQIDPRQLAAMDPRHAAMLQGINPAAVMGYPSGPYLYPAQMRYPEGHPGAVPPHIDTPEKAAAAAALMSPGSVAPPEGKALDLLQQHAQQYYSGTHKIHELKDAARRSSPSPSKPPPAPTTPKDTKRDNSSPLSTGKGSDKGGSPPPQRHVHTHHHTHVVGGSSYPIYGYNGALLPSPPTGSAAAFVPKP